MAAPNALKASVLAFSYIENKFIAFFWDSNNYLRMLFPSTKMTMKNWATNYRNLNCHILESQMFIYIADRARYNKDNLC